MVASLDGFVARKDGRVDWLETADEFADGETMDPGFIEAFLKPIDCHVMGSRTNETAREPRLRPAFRNSWFAGGAALASECLRLGLADEVCYSIVPVLIGDGIPFFANLDRDIALHLVGVGSRGSSEEGADWLQAALGTSRRVTQVTLSAEFGHLDLAGGAAK